MVEDYKPRVKSRSSRKTKSHINNLLRFFIWMTLCVSITMMILCAMIYVSTTEVFHVKSIHIEKTPHLKEGEALSMLNLEEGDNIFSWDMRLAKQRLEAHPWVKAVRISRRFIPASVDVEIKEYIPIACVIIGDKRYLVSEEGKVFASAPKDFDGLVIKGVERTAFGTEEVKVLLQEGINIVRLLEGRGYLVKDISLGMGGKTEIRLCNGICMEFWDDISISKVDRALAIMKKVSPRDGMIIDLSFDDKVILRFEGRGA
ncbi:MAG: FtsQ-type POTRA domain-containing protein [Deltaproteobacteria bacterium]|nr:FtsQ-type POTRA domain-containing protein [Deltaproteobacteria bacterium]